MPVLYEIGRVVKSEKWVHAKAEYNTTQHYLKQKLTLGYPTHSYNQMPLECQLLILYYMDESSFLKCYDKIQHNPIFHATSGHYSIIPQQ